MPRHVITYERAVLHREVWSRPLRDVAEGYGVSDVALGKVCRRLFVPIPTRGHWANSRRSVRPRLPAAPPGVPTTLRLASSHRGRRDALPVPATERAAAEEARHGRVVVRPTLEGAHRLVAATMRAIGRAEVRPDGLVLARACGGLDVVVSPPLVDRALRIFDAVIVAFEVRGHRVLLTPGGRDPLTGAPDRLKTRAIVDGADVDLRITEPTRRAKSSAAAASSPRTSRLHLVVSGLTFDFVWKDGPRRAVEERLDELFARLYSAVGNA